MEAHLENYERVNYSFRKYKEYASEIDKLYNLELSPGDGIWHGFKR
jgi:hypothetical protein